jgi:hypothetical protein
MIPTKVSKATDAVTAWNTNPSEADLISKIVESPNAIFSVLEVMVFDETEPSETVSQGKLDESCSTCPLQRWDFKSMIDLEL